MYKLFMILYDPRKYRIVTQGHIYFNVLKSSIFSPWILQRLIYPFSMQLK
jgi:hypothetical protein